MNLTKYWGWQAELDRNILETHNLVENEELLQKKILALNVELGELANEWRGFKFWSTKGASAKEKILGEWVDCLHFILSIGNQKGYRVDKVVRNYTNTTFELFLSLYASSNRMINDLTQSVYESFLSDFIGLGKSLGFKVYEIEAAYLSKNETNHKRQEDGY